MIAENVNTHAHGDVHLVVLAHLRRRWSLSGRDGFGEFLEVIFTVFSALDAGFGSIGRWPQRPVSYAARRLASFAHRHAQCKKGSEYQTRDVSVRGE
jgi:hypothetical protein